MNILNLCAAALLFAQGPMPPAENAGPNASIVRRAGGSYAYTTISDGRHRGEEHFQLVVHPDGSRTMMIWHDLSARNAQFSVVLRVASSFRPLEAYVSYWNAGQFKGSGMFSVDAGTLTAQSRGSAGPRSETIDLPQRFSIGTHPVAGDGWHTWTFDAAGPAKQTSMLYGVEASSDITKPVLGALTPLAIELVGRERLSVPAGTYDTTHYRVAGVNDLWVTEQDRLVVKSSIPSRDLEYVLASATGSWQ